MSVYFAEAGGFMKIGYSHDPIMRSASITTGKAEYRPAEVERGATVDLLGWFPGDRDTEHATHVALGAYRVHREWFRDCAEVRAYFRRQADVVSIHEMSGMAVFEVLRGVPVAEAMATSPLGDLADALARLPLGGSLRKATA